MDNIFEIVNEKVVINTNVLLIPWLKRIVDKYDDPLPALGYCHYFSDPLSPYYTFPEDVRKEKLLQDFPGEYKVTDVEIGNALNELYKIRIKYNSIIRHWSSCKTLLDKFSDYADTVILNDNRAEGNMNDAQKILDKLEKNISNFKKATKFMEEETSKTRGAVRLAYDQ